MCEVSRNSPFFPFSKVACTAGFGWGFGCGEGDAFRGVNSSCEQPKGVTFSFTFDFSEGFKFDPPKDEVKDTGFSFSSPPKDGVKDTGFSFSSSKDWDFSFPSPSNEAKNSSSPSNEAKDKNEGHSPFSNEYSKKEKIFDNTGRFVPTVDRTDIPLRRISGKVYRWVLFQGNLHFWVNPTSRGIPRRGCYRIWTDRNNEYKYSSEVKK